MDDGEKQRCDHTRGDTLASERKGTNMSKLCEPTIVKIRNENFISCTGLTQENERCAQYCEQ